MNNQIQKIINDLNEIKLGQAQKVEAFEKEVYQIFKIEEQLNNLLDESKTLNPYHWIKKFKKGINQIIKEEFYDGYKFSALKSSKFIFKANQHKEYFYSLLKIAQKVKQVKFHIEGENIDFLRSKNELKSVLNQSRIEELIILAKEGQSQKDQADLLPIVKEDVSNKSRKSFRIRDILDLEENKTSTSNSQAFLSLPTKDNATTNNLMISNKEEQRIAWAVEGLLSFYDKIKEANESQGNLNENPRLSNNSKIKSEKSKITQNRHNQLPINVNEKVINWLNSCEVQKNASDDLYKKIVNREKALKSLKRKNEVNKETSAKRRKM